ncbi:MULTISPECIES: acyl-CoA dehydrogenase family protein [Bacillus cereus group]|uniref:acyl-CoA dehydrogenase family protein n=2 Tax=Bacillus TaxID=1386 RepID=UPI0008FE3EE2|nr:MULTISPECIES: acyl-CoA dehydrogenase family protein [Bacillus cereus group]MDX5837381.1 acyl-CoA dehydrogenase family protein [Bacillus cereus group sp. BfR-BA-01700]OJE41836.1 acyl-CoA dehydrogenase [Bacillus mobilis]HDR7244410.1 acyl-CoA dehydrogenase family protein [Bacillus mobilis]HDX9641176.1 acyl-CoA dehydrogenase family protein [Bacillus mobilis]
MKNVAEQLSMQEGFRSFVDEHIVPNAAMIDKEQYIPKDIIHSLAQEGYLGSMLPSQYGGMELDMLSIGILNEEVGRGCSSVRSLLTVHGMVALAIHRWGTQEQREYWLPKLATGSVVGAFGLTEPHVGSDAKSIQTTAVRDGDDYVLNGVKRWITMGQVADLFLIFARCEEGPAAFLVERTQLGLEVDPIYSMLGAKGSMLGEIKLTQCRIPKENLIGQIGTGLSHVALSCLDYGRYTIAWGCVGLAQACLEQSLNYAKKRQQFGSSIGNNQLIQKIITEMIVQVKAARLLCVNAGRLKDEGDPESIMETWNAKYYASLMATRVANDAVQIHGANGCFGEYPVERYYRDAKINEIIEGTSQMHEVMIATYALASIN